MMDSAAAAPVPSSDPGGVALLVSNDADAIRQVSESATQLAISLEVCTEPSAVVRRLGQSKFEAVIVDLELGRQGYSILEQVRASQRNRTAVTFIITSSIQEGTSALKTGSNFVLQRPLSADSIDRTFRAAYGLIVRELRRSFRCPMAVPAVVQRPGQEDTRCQTLDISEGGLGVSTPLVLEPGTEVTIQFTLPGHTAPLSTAAELCWCDSKGRLGLRFLNLSSSQKSELQGWLSSRLEKSLPEAVVKRFRRNPPT
jgi:ActR/RegA family two-component response regulator